MSEKYVDPVLLEVIRKLDSSELYELMRGLILSNVDKQALIDLLHAELKHRADAPKTEGGAK